MKNIILLSTVLSSLIYASGPVYKTGQNSKYNDHDDGFYQSGVEATFKSAADNNDIILDTRLNLYWQNDYKLNDENDTWPEYNYYDAVTYCKSLGDQWRLPTRLEVKTISSFYKPDILTPVERVHKLFQDTVGYDSIEVAENGTAINVVKFWTSTESNDLAWVADLYNGADRAVDDKSNKHNVRCVKSNDLETIKSDYTQLLDKNIVIDNITHLMWQDTPSQSGTWEEAINYCEELTYLGYKDWRLPNFNELYFTTNIDTQVFTNMEKANYWSSTAVPTYTEYKFVVNGISGIDTAIEKSNSTSLRRCVRSIKNNSLPAIINYLLN